MSKENAEIQLHMHYYWGLGEIVRGAKEVHLPHGST